MAKTMAHVTRAFQALALLPQNAGTAQLALSRVMLGPGPPHSQEPQPPPAQPHARPDSATQRGLRL